MYGPQGSPQHDSIGVRRRRYAIALEVQHGALRALPVSDLPLERDLTLIWRKDCRLPAAAVAFLNILGPPRLHVRQAS